MKFKTAICTLFALTVGTTTALADGYQTGLVDLTIRDTTGDRHLQGFLWYPTTQTEGALRAHGNAVWEPIRVIPNATAVDGKHPLVLLSHGMFGNARNQTWLAKELTAKGYIVAAIDHPGTSTFQKDPEHQRQLWERANDITRTIDHVLETNTYGPLIDQDRIFMGGHSLGGFTAMLLAGGRYDPVKMDGFCVDPENQLVCGIFDRWNVAKTTQDRKTIAQDWSDQRIKAFAVFDLGGTQSFSTESLANVKRPMLVYGAPVENSGLDLNIESRALIAALPKANTHYVEPATLAHFDFLGICTPAALEILKEENPDDVVVCAQGTDARAQKHQEIANQVDQFFSDL